MRRLGDDGGMDIGEWVEELEVDNGGEGSGWLVSASVSSFSCKDTLIGESVTGVGCFKYQHL